MPLLPADFTQPSLQTNLRIILDGTQTLLRIILDGTQVIVHYLYAFSNLRKLLYIIVR